MMVCARETECRGILFLKEKTTFSKMNTDPLEAVSLKNLDMISNELQEFCVFYAIYIYPSDTIVGLTLRDSSTQFLFTQDERFVHFKAWKTGN